MATFPLSRGLASGALALAALALPAAAPAQSAASYPSQPLHIMVGASPGGGTDILARMLADKLTPALKQSVVVENRPGASNTIAADLTARAEPDGLTLLVATNTGQSIAPHLLKLKYDPLKDLQPIGMVAIMPNVLVVSSASPYKSMKDLVAAMKARPGDLKYGSSGVGSTQHVGAEAFNLAAGTRAIHIPYKGSSQAHIDIISGQVDMMFDSTSSAMNQIKAGKLRALAVSAPHRSPGLPDVPTLAESGITGADVNTWYGLYTTRGTPPEIVSRLHDELVRALGHPDVKARIADLGGEIDTMNQADFAKLNEREFQRYGQLVRTANIKAE